MSLTAVAITSPQKAKREMHQTELCTKMVIFWDSTTVLSAPFFHVNISQALVLTHSWTCFDIGLRTGLKGVKEKIKGVKEKIKLP